MAVHFHPLKIKNIQRETPGAVVVSFDVPHELKHLFNFEQGQNITLRIIIEGEEVRRSYSICTAPFEDTLSVAVKKLEGGRFSSYVNEHLQKGDTMEVLPPTGRFNTPLSSENRKNYLAFAAGSGITPIISIIKTSLYMEPLSRFTLVYGNRSRGSIMFFEELAGLKNRYVDRFNLVHILSREIIERPINNGRIDQEKMNELRRVINYQLMDEIFICGPLAMLNSVREYLEKLGIDHRRIHYELFSTPGFEQPPPAAVPGITAKESNIVLTLDGISMSFNMPAGEDSILDAALKQGADLPFACKGGVCATCRAKLLAGKVKMDVNYALEEEELAAGFILTCQSHPLTELVEIDYDSR